MTDDEAAELEAITRCQGPACGHPKWMHPFVDLPDHPGMPDCLSGWHYEGESSDACKCVEWTE
jgi:hypothetical protein